MSPDRWLRWCLFVLFVSLTLYVYVCVNVCLVFFLLCMYGSSRSSRSSRSVGRPSRPVVPSLDEAEAGEG